MRKGVSPIIATVILIAITITIGFIVYVSSSSYLSGLGPPPDCRSVSFDAGIYQDATTSNYVLEASNYGNKKIMGFLLVIEDANTESKDTEEINFELNPGDSKLTEIQSVIVFPELSPVGEGLEDGGDEESKEGPTESTRKKIIAIPIVNNKEGKPMPCPENYALPLN